MLNDSPIAAKEKESEIKSISNSWGVYEQWSRYKENEVNNHCSYGERNVILNQVERQQNEVEKSSPLDVV